jgi:hypothetical protein
MVEWAESTPPTIALIAYQASKVSRLAVRCRAKNFWFHDQKETVFSLLVRRGRPGRAVQGFDLV